MLEPNTGPKVLWVSWCPGRAATKGPSHVSSPMFCTSADVSVCFFHGSQALGAPPFSLSVSWDQASHRVQPQLRGAACAGAPWGKQE